MANKAYAAIALTGGGTGALDAIDGAGLVDGDLALVIDAVNNVVELYTLNSTVGGASSSPTLIPPALNAGDKRWELVKLYAKDSITLNDGTNIGILQFSTNVLELYQQKHGGVVRVSIEDGAGNKETSIVATGGGSVDLYYDNVKKLETTALGVTVTGAVVSDSPKFFSQTSADLDNVTGDGTTEYSSAAAWADVFDTSSSFAAGVFTAPRTGYYLLGGTLVLKGVGAGHTTFGFRMVVNTVPYVLWGADAIGIANAAGYIYVNGSILAYLVAAQQAYFNFDVTGATKIVDLVTGTSFWGHYIS